MEGEAHGRKADQCVLCFISRVALSLLVDVEFIADDKGELTSALGLLFDASGLLGGPRSKVRVVSTALIRVSDALVAVRHHRGEWLGHSCCGRGRSA